MGEGVSMRRLLELKLVVVIAMICTAYCSVTVIGQYFKVFLVSSSITSFTEQVYNDQNFIGSLQDRVIAMGDLIETGDNNTIEINRYDELQYFLNQLLQDGNELQHRFHHSENAQRVEDNLNLVIQSTQAILSEVDNSNVLSEQDFINHNEYSFRFLDSLSLLNEEYRKGVLSETSMMIKSYSIAENQMIILTIRFLCVFVLNFGLMLRTRRK